MKRIMAVYDVDPFYADKFAEFANQKEKTPFTAVAFSSLSRLKAFAEQQPVELLLVGEEVEQRELEELLVGQIVRLSETGMTAEDGAPVVYKYQPSDDVLREVMACYQVQPEPVRMAAVGRGSTVIGIYSPVNRCGKTGFALTMGQILSKESKVLYLSLEENSGLSKLTGTQHRGSLSDLLYYFRQGQYSGMRLSAVTYSLGNLDYVPPVTYAEDLADVSGGELEMLLARIAGERRYEVILLDLGQFGKGVENLLEMCDLIYVPVREDCVSTAKLEEWRQYLEVSKRGTLWERMKMLKLPNPGIAAPAEAYLEQLLWGEVGDFVRCMLKGQDTEWRH